jgi:hypothetical protein
MMYRGFLFGTRYKSYDVQRAPVWYQVQKLCQRAPVWNQVESYDVQRASVWNQVQKL